MARNNIKINNKKSSTKLNSKWVINIVIMTILISVSISLLKDTLLSKVNTLVAFVILICIIMLGILFDIIGVAVTAADEMPFHAMASKKIPGAKISIKLIRNADKVSNICNDVFGDICGIVSGSMGALILVTMSGNFSKLYTTIITVSTEALIMALTVGGKAIGKTIAINNCNVIIYKVSKIIYFVKKDK